VRCADMCIIDGCILRVDSILEHVDTGLNVQYLFISRLH